jgi:hypothetical protein
MMRLRAKSGTGNPDNLTMNERNAKWKQIKARRKITTEKEVKENWLTKLDKQTNYETVSMDHEICC